MNDRVEDLINGLSGHVSLLDTAMKLTAVDLVFLAPLLLAALWLWPMARRERALNQRLAFATGLAVIGAVIAAALLAHLHHDTRPFVTDGSTRLLISHSADNGFPSDHAAFAFAIGGAIVWWRRALGACAIAAASLIAVARIYVGVHWPSDVVAGAVLGLAIGAVVAKGVPLLVGPQRLFSRLLPEALVAAP